MSDKFIFKQGESSAGNSSHWKVCFDMQEELADIQTEQQIDVIKAQAAVTSDDEKKAPKARTRKGSVNTGRGRGRPRTVNTDKWGNRLEGENNWEKWNITH